MVGRNSVARPDNYSRDSVSEGRSAPVLGRSNARTVSALCISTSAKFPGLLRPRTGALRPRLDILAATYENTTTHGLEMSRSLDSHAVPHDRPIEVLNFEDVPADAMLVQHALGKVFLM